MATLADKPMDEIKNAIHLLLVGPSKVGKTDYVADAVKDGFTVLYVDNDNGLNTLLKKIGNDEAAKARCHYVSTLNLWEFTVNFFAKTRFQWNETKDSLFSASSAADEDDILEIYPKQIPFGVIIVLDSWTSLCLQLLKDSAEKNNVAFENFNEAGQAAYGDANRRATVVCSNIQAFPGHVIVQAHPEFFERMEKPKGVAKDIKAKDMIIKENIMIPSSVSRPHGYNMAKYFNEVGWMRIGAMGDFKLDFRQMSDRIGGGSAGKDGDPKKDLRFSQLVPVKSVPDGWIRTIKAAGLKEEARIAAEEKARIAAEKAEAAKLAKQQAGGAANKPAQGITTPAKPGGLLSGKK